MSAPIYKGGRPFVKPGIRIGNNTGLFSIAGAPTDGTSGTLVGVAGPGALLMRTNGTLYVNSNTKASPAWTVLSAQQPSVTTKVLAATQTADANVVAATLTGFSWTLVAGATYQFEMDLFTTLTTVGGLTLSFLLTTATLTSIAYGYRQAVTTTVGGSNGTTTTSATKVIDNKTAAYTSARVFGSMVVNAGGTFTWQFCQNTSAAGADASLILLGSSASMVRTA